MPIAPNKEGSDRYVSAQNYRPLWTSRCLPGQTFEAKAPVWIRKKVPFYDVDIREVSHSQIFQALVRTSDVRTAQDARNNYYPMDLSVGNIDGSEKSKLYTLLMPKYIIHSAAFNVQMVGQIGQ